MKNLHIIIKNTKDPNALLQKLYNCYKMHFAILPDCKEAMFLQSYIKLLGMPVIFCCNLYGRVHDRLYSYCDCDCELFILLEWQVAIEQRRDNERLALNSSVLESLRYAYKCHSNTPENYVISPIILSRDHDISPRLYEKVALQVKAVCGAWDDIDRLLLARVTLFISL